MNSPSFHPDQSDKVRRFIETYCLQVADTNYGKAGSPTRLIQWELDFLDNFYSYGSYVDGKWKRARRKGLVWIPKKSGKSGYAAQLALHAGVEVAGQQVIICASSIKQSKIIYEECAAMAESHPALDARRGGVYWTRDNIKEIRNVKNRSVIRVIANNPAGASGPRGCCICDEIGEWPPSSGQLVWDKLQDLYASTWNGFLLSFSTANHNMGEAVGYQQFLRSEQVAKDPSLDPLMLPVIYSCPPHLWNCEEGWKIANPAWGTIIQPDDFRATFQSVQNNYREQRRFKIFRLNIWQAGMDSFIDPDTYARAVRPFQERDLHGGTFFGALDLSRRKDFTVWLGIVEKEGKLHILPRIFTPESTLDRKSQEDKVPLREWVSRGWVIATPGDSIRQEDLIPHILQDARDFHIHSIRYDPHMADLLAQELSERHGFTMEEVKGNSGNALVIPTVELERHFQANKIVVPENDCLKWCFENAVLRRVGADGIIIDKSKCTARVDAAVASVLAMSGYMASKDAHFADPTSGFVV